MQFVDPNDLDDPMRPYSIVRIGLTLEQVRAVPNARLRQGIEVKRSDTRSENYVAEYGDRCWEADILPASVIEQAINDEIHSWIDAAVWNRRDAEIERARKLL